ncbi:MAG: hypothetical protein V3U98_09495 [Acidobacteriota bacterium]
MTAHSEPPAGARPGTGEQAADAAQGAGPERLTYQGIRFPWWLTIIWIAFLAWGMVYLVLYYVPDLRAWLQH